jgi:hypothetical protein
LFFNLSDSESITEFSKKKEKMHENIRPIMTLVGSTTTLFARLKYMNVVVPPFSIYSSGIYRCIVTVMYN